MGINARSAISAINKLGICLVFPIDNAKEPESLWTHFFPRKKMRWEWDSSGDVSVADLWHLREELSRSGKVVYTKWYKGRATFFSRELFTASLHLLGSADREPGDLTSEAREVLTQLEESSPLSTKELKKAAGLQGKFFESTYQKALKSLWEKLLIVGYGEVDDGAFPSLAMGATKLLFEDLWNDAQKKSAGELFALHARYFNQSPVLQKYWDKMLTKYSYSNS